MRVAWLGLALGAAGRGTHAATIEGTVIFPSPSVPAMTAYAFDAEVNRLRSVSVPRGRGSFALDVPPGRYLVFLAPADPGAPDVYGAHTQYSLCRAHDPNGACEDHALDAIVITARTQRAEVTVDDWFLTSEVSARLDHIRGTAPGDAGVQPWRPHFSEYPAEEVLPPAARVEAAALKPPSPDRADLKLAVATGPNFAGHLSVVPARCGSDCVHLWLLDWRDASLADQPLVGTLGAALPCRRGEALAYRRDSRLLEVTVPDGDEIVTRYFVWDPARSALGRLTEHRRSVQTFCAAATP